MILAPGMPVLLSLRAAELAAAPDAAHWAGRCGWVPGTGHCRNRVCSAACLFRPQCDAEVGQVQTRRLRRRVAQQPFAGRGGSR
jgi:hypothetical protein